MKTAAKVTGGAPGGAEATAAVVDAWHSLRDGRGDVSHYEIVLADLATFSGYFDTPPVDSSMEAIQRWLGRREICSRILFLAGIQGDALVALREAADAERQLRTPDDQ